MIEVRPGGYLVDGQRWENDWAAEAYQANEFRSDDSVIDLSTQGPRRDRRG